MEVPKIGQPLKLIKPGVRDKILTALGRGATYAIACGYAGISLPTFRKYLKKGEALVDMFEEQIEQHEDKAFYEFYLQVKSVECYAAIKWLDKIDKASDFHWQAAAWKLERCHPEDYGKDRPEDKDLAENTSEIKKLRETLEKCRKE